MHIGRIDHMRSTRMFSFPDNMAKLITRTMITWAKTDFIYDRTLVGQMFSLIHRQYDGVGEVRHSSMYSSNDYHMSVLSLPWHKAAFLIFVLIIPWCCISSF